MITTELKSTLKKYNIHSDELYDDIVELFIMHYVYVYLKSKEDFIDNKFNSSPGVRKDFPDHYDKWLEKIK